MAITDQTGGRPPDHGAVCNWIYDWSLADLQRLQTDDVVTGRVCTWKLDDSKPDRERLLAESSDH